MTLLFIRIFFLIISSFVGYYVGSTQTRELLGLGIGFSIGAGLILLEASLRRVSVRGLSSMVFGLLLGIVMAKLITDILSLLPLGDYFQSILKVSFTLLFAYLGAVMALRGRDEFHLVIPYVRFKRQDVEERVCLLDTSAIIDGRIADIYKTNFFIDRVVVPRFVLQELQKISDSKDGLKRQRGRRGMEMLRNMQKDSSMELVIQDEDSSAGDDVDAKLVRLAKVMDARICTVDYNLGRIAMLQGVKVLNINELVNAVKPIVISGEEMDVRLLKEGKEQDQAVAYTDDGTMIVVSDARSLIGRRVKVVVSSVLQTPSGRIIFAKLQNAAPRA